MRVSHQCCCSMVMMECLVAVGCAFTIWPPHFNLVNFPFLFSDGMHFHAAAFFVRNSPKSKASVITSSHAIPLLFWSLMRIVSSMNYHHQSFDFLPAFPLRMLPVNSKHFCASYKMLLGLNADSAAMALLISSSNCCHLTTWKASKNHIF